MHVHKSQEEEEEDETSQIQKLVRLGWQVKKRIA